jgi:ribosomal protein S18 acetylase RimI-like enzyme
VAITSRLYQSDDYEKVRKFLQTSYSMTGCLHNWPLRRWDGWYFHRANLSEVDTSCFLVWENETDEIVGVIHPEYEGSAFIEIHPDYRHIEAEMIAWAEECLPVRIDGSAERKLHFWIYEWDIQRQTLLKERGFEALPHYGYTRQRLMVSRIPSIELAEGYTIRAMRFDDKDCAKMADLLNAAFGRSIHSAAEYANFQTAPCYRVELDSVVIAPDGRFAATAGVTLDEANHYAEFEPVCTHPQHQRKGLAAAVMAEGLRRLQCLEVAIAYVGAGDNPAANALYEKMGFIHAEKVRLWQKIWVD